MTQKNKAGSMILGVAFVWFTTHFGGGFASGGILFANSSKKYEKMPPETDVFWTSFTFKRLACYETVKGIDSATDPLPLPLR